MERLKEKIYRKFIEIVPADETYFVSVDKPKIKLTKELVILNYSHLSIHKSGDVIFCTDKDKLYIWFAKEKLMGKKIFIPEGFLILKTLKDNKNSIVIRKKDDKQLFFVIKDGFLTAQIYKSKHSVENGFIELLKKKYSITDIVYMPDKTEPDKGILDIKDIFRFIDISGFNKKDIMEKSVEFIKLPLIVLFLMLSIGDLLYYNHVNSALSKEKTYLSQIRNQNADIKNKFTELEKQKNFWYSFQKGELDYPGLFDTLNIIAKVLAHHNGEVNIFRKSINIVTLWETSDSSSSLVKDLMKTGYFSNVNIISVSQKQDKETAQLELTLKPL